MELLSKKELIARGWSKAAINHFFPKSHLFNEQGHYVWELSRIERIEQSLSYKSFTTEAEFQERNKKLEALFAEKTEFGTEHVQSSRIVFENHNCLLNNKDNYNPFKSIFHLCKEDFIPEEDGSYTLFTDGSFKAIGKESFACCAGWIMDNKTNEIIIEFTKIIDINSDQLNEKLMPEFELMGIHEGVKAISQLGLKNVQCFTDSIGEAKTIFFALGNIGDKRINSNKDSYNEIIDILKNTNSSIGWIPREYNYHADELTKFPLNAWVEQHMKAQMDNDYFKEYGYLVDREKDIYFNHSKIKYVQAEQSPLRFTLFSTYYTTVIKDKKIKDMVTLLHDKENDSFAILDMEKRGYSHIDPTLPLEIQNIKKTKSDGINLAVLCASLKKLHHIEGLNVCAPAGTIAVLQKFAPIPVNLQEEYFEFHKVCNEFPGKLNVVNFEKRLHNKINKILQEKYVEIFENQGRNQPKI